jgi:hypothetical protein
MKYLFVLILSTLFVNAQTIDNQSIFKMQIFVDKAPYVYKSDQNIKKNDSTYFSFSNSYELKLSKLKSNNYYQFFDDFEFLELLMYDNSRKQFADNVVLKKELSEDANAFAIGVGKGSRYVLAINQKNGKSYRLVGFNGNDFLELMRDFLDSYNSSASKKINSNDFLKKFEIKTVDLNCIAEGLLSKNADRIKYPCLVRVSDLITIR